MSLYDLLEKRRAFQAAGRAQHERHPTMVRYRRISNHERSESGGLFARQGRRDMEVL